MLLFWLVSCASAASFRVRFCSRVLSPLLLALPCPSLSVFTTVVQASRWKQASDTVHPILGNHLGHHKEKAAPAEKTKVKTRGDVASEIIDAKHHELTQPQVESPDQQLVCLTRLCLCISICTSARQPAPWVAFQDASVFLIHHAQ